LKYTIEGMRATVNNLLHFFITKAKTTQYLENSLSEIIIK